MNLTGISEKAKEMLENCGYGKEKLFATAELSNEPFLFYSDEGYNVTDALREIVESFYMLRVGKGGRFENGTFIAEKNVFLDNMFIVYPENMYDAFELFEKFSKAIGDRVAPLGIINEDYLAFGESGCVHIIGEEIYKAGENFVDFLNNFAENKVYLPEKILK